MKLADNPFMILEITTAASLEEIDEAASEKSFADDEHEDVYNNARMTLSSPNKRLSAEVRWFYTVPVNSVKVMDATYITDSREKLLALLEKRGYALEDFANVLLNIDWAYDQACSDEAVRELLEKINASRKVAKVTNCEFRQVKEAVVSIIEDIEKFINEETTNYNESGLAKVGNIVAAEILNSNRTIGVGFEKFINVYNVKLRTSLENYREEILNIDIPALKESCDNAKLQAFCTKVRKFDYLAQPLQVFLLKQGRSELQEESIDIARAIRNLAIYFHNEKEDSTTTLALLELENELFSELPEIYEAVKGDISTVTRIKTNNDSIGVVVQYIRKLREDLTIGHGQAVQMLIKEAPGLLAKVQNSGASEEVIAEAKNIIAGAIVNFAIAYGNQSKDWASCRQFLLEARKYATDRELLNRISLNQKVLNGNIAQKESEYDEEKTARLKNIVKIVLFLGVVIYFLNSAMGCGSSSHRSSTPRKNVTTEAPRLPAPNPTIPKPSVKSEKKDNAAAKEIKPAKEMFAKPISMSAISDVYATSADREGNYVHSASLTIDGDRSTCWSEGVPGDGVGESITYEFDNIYKVSGLNIWIGHQKSQDLFRKNAKPKVIRIEASDGSVERWSLNNSMNGQHIEFNKPKNINRLKITIMSTYSGTKWQDTCISEIKFF